MKNLFLTLFTLSLVNMSATAQIEQYNQRPNGDHYLTPDSYGNPIPLDVYYYDSITGHDRYYNSSMMSGTTSMRPGMNVIYDIAQPCYSDTLLTIIGVSALFGNISYNDMNGYLHIADTDFNIYHTLRIPRTVYDTGRYSDDIDKNYAEMFFEQPINVKGRFLVIWDNPKPDVSNVQYDYDYNYNAQDIFYTHLKASKDIKDADVIYKYLPYERQCTRDTLFAWEKQCDIMITFSGTQIHRYQPQIYYLFPIFGELDTTLECVGCYADSSIDSIDVGLTNNIMVDMYTYIFPNPVKEELNVQCSFKIEEIEIYNNIGIKVLSKQVSAYYTTINTSSLDKGSYILKIKTKNGYTDKKIVVK